MIITINEPGGKQLVNAEISNDVAGAILMQMGKILNPGVQTICAKAPLALHFRFDISCRDCNAALEADGHGSMDAIDVWLGEHIRAYGHFCYKLSLNYS